MYIGGPSTTACLLRIAHTAHIQNQNPLNSSALLLLLLLPMQQAEVRNRYIPSVLYRYSCDLLQARSRDPPKFGGGRNEQSVPAARRVRTRTNTKKRSLSKRQQHVSYVTYIQTYTVTQNRQTGWGRAPAVRTLARTLTLGEDRRRREKTRTQRTHTRTHRYTHVNRTHWHM